MNHLKKFEELDFSKTSPIASVSALTNYYNCVDCNAAFKSFLIRDLKDVCIVIPLILIQFLLINTIRLLIPS